ncbi:MAG: enoyl-CoA hydratase, partial [Acidobacteria bacterium]|nr:enoyl-CoA hydratase [Acidobacteriota bacterium]
MDEVVLYEVEGGVATVTMNRPEARNALSSELRVRLFETMARAGDDPAVNVVILTGTDPAFCAGLDLREISGERARTVEPPEPVRDHGMHRYFPVLDKPVIGAVNGAAITGGLEVALQCTFLVASERARFADTHARVGIMPGGGATVFLHQTVGLRRAIEMSLTGNFMGAEEALARGLVNHVVPHDELLPFTRKLAADIAGNDQRAVRELYRMYRSVAHAPSLHDAYQLEGDACDAWRRPDEDM